MLVPADYPELAVLCLKRDPTLLITEEEALALYERDWRWVRRLPLREVEPSLYAGDAARKRKKVCAVDRGFLVAQCQPPLYGGKPVLDAGGALIEPSQQDQYQVVRRFAHWDRMP